MKRGPTLEVLRLRTQIAEATRLLVEAKDCLEDLRDCQVSPGNRADDWLARAQEWLRPAR